LAPSSEGAEGARHDVPGGIPIGEGAKGAKYEEADWHPRVKVPQWHPQKRVLIGTIRGVVFCTRIWHPKWC